MSRILPLNSEGKVQFIPPGGKGTLWPHVSRWGVVEWTCWLQQIGWNDEAIRQYVQHDRYHYGFGLRRGPKEPFNWFYLPIPKQVEMHACRIPNVGFGGAAGGSKSHGSRWDAYRHCWAIPGFHAIIMRRTFQELKRNHMNKARLECLKINDYLGKEVMQYVPSEFEIRFAHNNSLITFGHCQNPGDEEKYLGDEYDAFYPDEVATFLQSQIMGVAGRLRSVIDGVEPRLVGTTNPAGAHTQWYVDWFLSGNVDLDEYPEYNKSDYHFIQSKLWDNPWLMDKDGTFTKYIKRLSNYSPMRRRQLLEGDWTAIFGQFFEDFNHPARFVKYALSELRACRFERWIDWGYSKPGVCVWVAIFPNGKIHTFAEYKFQNTIASVVAANIRDETKRLFNIISPGKALRVSKTIADPSMFNLDGHVGESYADTFKRFGVICVEGDNQRVLGWGRMRHWTAMDHNGTMWWTVDQDACPYTARTIGALTKDKDDPEDLDTDGEDHSADAHRYGFFGRPSPESIKPQQTEVLTDSIKALLNTLTPQQQHRPAGKVA